MRLTQAKLRGTGTSIVRLLIAAMSLVVGDAVHAQRVTSNLLTLYTFEEGQGDTVNDRAGVGKPLDLKIKGTKSSDWQQGKLVIHSSTSIVSSAPATKIIDSVKRSGEITIEAWLQPETNSQAGPARIVSLSVDTSRRNVTLGQEKDHYDVRLRTTKTDQNGLPSTASPGKSLQTKLTHVVFTRESNETARIYLNGKQVTRKKVAHPTKAYFVVCNE